MSIAAGTRLGQYEVQEFIGQGAMGLVYRAYHAQLERTGAIKVMQAISPDADSVARFRHEAQAIAKMRHPNIVDVYDFGEFEGTPYMIVEYVPGGSLATRMAHGRLDRPTALKYLRGIAAGLDYAHGHGVVHRDVKPANVLIHDDDTPVLADFGLAKLLQGSSLKSMTGVTTGTPAYMAPEQVTGSQVGPASDRYSLATIAYEMLTGVIPFDGEALMELLYAQVHRQPMSPSSRYPDLGPAVDAVIMRGLAKDPGARWESSTAFVDALAAALATPAPAAVRSAVMTPAAMASTVPIARGAPAVKAPPTARTEVMPAPAAVAPTAPVPRAAKKRQHWRRRGAIAAAALLLLVVIFGVCQALVATTLALNPNVAALGQDVRVTAAHVPASKAGTIELHSVIHTFAFRADSNGRVDTFIKVPDDIPLGDHTVDICWDHACRASATLRVVEGTGIVLPAGNLSPAPGSPSPSHLPTPGSTPQPSSTAPPTSSPTAQPTSSPTSPPTSNPCPTPAPPATLTATPNTVVGGQKVTITGSSFTPNRSVTLEYYHPATAPSPATTWYASTNCSGAFTTPLTTKAAIALQTDKVVACDAAGRCASTTISILLL